MGLPTKFEPNKSFINNLDLFFFFHTQNNYMFYARIFYFRLNINFYDVRKKKQQRYDDVNKTGGIRLSLSVLLKQFIQK